MADAVRVTGLRKRYEGLFGASRLDALKGLTLSIPRGVAFGLIGPNGAGKTTFIKLLLGVVRPTAGELEVLGGDPQDLQVRARIGYLPERMHLPAALKGRDFLRSVATLKSLSPTDAELGSMLARVGLADSGQRIGTFSKGMRQRLGLAAAMLGQPDLLILDEPTDGIDPVGRVEVRTILLQEKQRGATLLLNSHLLAETERVCDRIGVLQQGELKLEGTLEEIRSASSAWVLSFATAPAPELVERAGLTAGLVFQGDVEALNRAIDTLRAGGASLTGVVPRTRDLEAVLTELERGP